MKKLILSSALALAFMLSFQAAHAESDAEHGFQLREAQYSGSFTVGHAVLGSGKDLMEKFAFQAGVAIHVTVSRGMISRTISFTVKGDAKSVNFFIAKYNRFVYEMKHHGQSN